MAIIGKQLPAFELDAFRKPEIIKVSNKTIEGKWSVFVFYPADFTFVCPTELADLQDQYAELKDLGVEVFSVSVDSAFVHKAWFFRSRPRRHRSCRRNLRYGRRSFRC